MIAYLYIYINADPYYISSHTVVVDDEKNEYWYISKNGKIACKFQTNKAEIEIIKRNRCNVKNLKWARIISNPKSFTEMMEEFMIIELNKWYYCATPGQTYIWKPLKLDNYNKFITLLSVNGGEFTGHDVYSGSVVGTNSSILNRRNLKSFYILYLKIPDIFSV